MVYQQILFSINSIVSIVISLVKDTEYRFRRVILRETHVLDCGKMGSKKKMAGQSFLWYYSPFPDPPMNSEVLANSFTYTLEITHIKDQGYYFCFGFHNFLKKFYWIQYEIAFQG